MNARTCLLAGLLLVVGCEGQETQPAALDAPPPIVEHVIGPQPGPDRPLPETRNPYAGDPDAPVDGRRLFVWYNCSGCHGGHAGGGMGPSLRDVVWRYGSSEQDVFNSIAAGRARGMPAWGTKLPADEIWKLVSYVRCLNDPCEASPPPPNLSYPSPAPQRGPEMPR